MRLPRLVGIEKGENVKLLVVRCNGETELLDVVLPVTFTGMDNSVLKMWQMHDAQGTDYFFNKSDGTYDGWGRAVACNSEAAELLDHAHKTQSPPTPKKAN